MNCTFLDYYRNNTQLEIDDLFKFLYQSCFGCEHLVSDYDEALDRIVKEAGSADKDDLPGIEPLDGEYCRVHLKVLDTVHSPEWLCEAFLKSSKKHPEGKERLEEQLQLLSEYAEDGLIAFDEEELEQRTDEWRRQGFPPIHHSETFREAHHPAYRVILKRYIDDEN